MEILEEDLHQSSHRRDASGTWLISPGVKNPKHVFVFIQQARKRNAYTQNLPLGHVRHLPPSVRHELLPRDRLRGRLEIKDSERYDQFPLQKERLQLRRPAAARQLPDTLPNHLLRSAERQRICDGGPEKTRIPLQTERGPKRARLHNLCSGSE